MQAIILAAGMGKRLGELTQGNTKAMVKVNGIPLIDRVLTQLSVVGLSRVIIVVGYEGDKLCRYIGSSYKGLKIEYVYNPVYDKTNNIYSLFLAKQQLQEDDTFLIESDLILDDSLFTMLLENPSPNLALVARYEPWMDGTMVKLDNENNIISFVPKKMFVYNETASYYKTVNVYKFSKSFSSTHYVPFLEAYIKALGNNEYYEQVLRVITLLDKCDLKALPLNNNQKWYEIDDVQDLDIAETIFADDEKKLFYYQKRYGGYWRFPNLYDFCYLVNPYFPPKELIEELKANFGKLLTEYPSGLGVNNLLLSKYFSLNKEYVCIGNGAAELIKSLMNIINGSIGVIYPTFEEYPNRCDKQLIVSYFPSNANFSYTTNDLKDFFADKEISYLLLINPDNPSGNFIPIDDVISLLDWAKEKQIVVVIDESFVDFSNEFWKNSLLHNCLLEEYSHLIVVKSISKSYGVPGLRLGLIATTNKEIMMKLRQDVAIWNINSFAEYYMQIFGKYQSEYNLACRKIICERDRFFEGLNQIDFLRVIPSQANYFLCEVISRFTSTTLADILLREYNILIKDCGSKSAFKRPNYIRIAIRNAQDNDFLIYALSEL
jgi:histidinol-phosphate/aromatic aminotransferase/cobyric acid decarboxylase-like protein/choline kinase